MQKLKFNGVWREYQKRILDDLNHHLSDNKIHVVAAPGAGKTTLGIEVLSRLNKPALILAPTITIRDQWKNRITTSFLENKDEDIISTDILNPKFITVITYQAFLAAFTGKNDDNEENQSDEEFNEDKITSNKRFVFNKAKNVIEILKENSTDILCFDEAHHLRKEWWKALDYLVDNLKPKQTVSLTATPPYDSDMKEWDRYEALCGPIDEVISIPELVQNGDLCPHQDFIHFSLMKDFEAKDVLDLNEKINTFFLNLSKNKEFINIAKYILSLEREDVILDSPKKYVSLASFLNAVGVIVPIRFLELIYLNEKEIPKFNLEFQKELLSFISDENNFSENDKKIIEEILKEARALGIIKNRQVMLYDSPSMKRKLANSLGKLDSIKKIVELETISMKNDLRMVILADYIKEDDFEMSSLGVIPIWQLLKERCDISLAVLTGSIVLIPNKILDSFISLLKERNLENDISYKKYDRDENFIKIISKTTKKSLLTEIVTDMFNKGFITVLIGTQALLGEGWDAPCINSLILSSTVSSYMLSNQMRGRAIRVDKNCPDKISNIWHLASVKILSASDIVKNAMNFDTTETGDTVNQLADYEQLKNRFMGFQAPSFSEPYIIQNGIERILPENFLNKIERRSSSLSDADFLGMNRIMENRAKDRIRTKKLWNLGVTKDYNAPARSLREGMETKIKLKELIYQNGYFTRLITTAVILFVILNSVFAVDKFIIFALCIYLPVLAIIMAKPTVQYLKCSTPEKIIRQIAIVMLETYYKLGKISSSLKNIDIRYSENPVDKTAFLSVSNVTPEENNLIIKSLITFLDPIENPKYILVRKDCLFGTVKTKDYHALPDLIGQNAKNVEIFKELWESRIGKCETFYTRNMEGRRMLLLARKNSYSSLLTDKKSRQKSRYE